MNTQIEHQEDHTIRLTVEVEQPRVEKAMHDTARRIAREVNIPGFRKGKAPYNIVLQRFGPQAILQETIDKLGQTVYQEAIDELKIEPYSTALLENIETTPTLKLVFTIPKRPEVTLSDYRAIRAPFEAPTVEDKDVDVAIKGLLDKRAVVETVQRPTQMTDVAKVKVFAETTFTAPEEIEPATNEAKPAEAKADEPKTEEEVEEATVTETIIDNENMTVLLSDDKEEDMLPGFSAQIVGLSAGETKEFDLAIPDDFEDEEIKGKTLNVKVEIIEVQSRILPVLNDDFAKLATDGKIETLLDLRIDTRTKLQESAQRQAEKKYSDQIFDQIVKDSAIKYPEAMVEEYTDTLVQELEEYLRENNLTLARYKQLGNKTDKDIRDMQRPRAIERITSSLVFTELVRVEHIHIRNEDIEEQIDKLTAAFGDQAAAFRTMFQRPETQNRIAMEIVSEKVSQRLFEIGQDKAPSLEALEAEHQHEHEHEHEAEHQHADDVAHAEHAEQHEAEAAQSEVPEVVEPTSTES